MKLGVFNLWTEMREQTLSAAFEVPPALFGPAPVRVAATTTEKAPATKRPTKKRKPVEIVDEITAS